MRSARGTDRAEPAPPAAPPARDCTRRLRTPLRFLSGIGPKRAQQLQRMGLATVEDLLYHLPFRYEDRRRIKPIREAAVGEVASMVGRLASLRKRFVPRLGRTLLEARLTDASGALELIWYRPTPYLFDQLRAGKTLLVHGKVEAGWGLAKRIVHPEFEVIEAGEGADRARILPVYPRTEGLPLSALRRWIAAALTEHAPFLASFLPREILDRQKLLPLGEALARLHAPGKEEDVAALNAMRSIAHRSVVFDELFYLQLGLALKRRRRRQASGIPFAPRGELTRRMMDLLPFRLTRAQERVLDEIYRGMSEQSPMQRLVQGDVGSGKTIVAWLASLRAIESGFQAVWLAPTELLAEQHFKSLEPYAGALGLRAVLLTGSVKGRAKSEILAEVASGAVPFVVGTHALIQHGVHIPRMGLGVIDEQHRFGVAQRLALAELTAARRAALPDLPQPDILLMSATPIPRSLAMVLYGDLEVSSLDEMPPGRSPVETRVCPLAARPRVYAEVRRELERGRQAFVVCPLVEASERLRARDATGAAEDLARGAFSGLPVGLVHGRMAAEERDRIMQRFRAGEIRALVATTVIEVGIDVPNAAVIVIEHAERFGLSQLHQLRGRVGRGREPGRCYLLAGEEGGGEAWKRLKVLEREHDGFRIAEADLALRGPGEFLGTRQSGFPDFRLANLMRDAALLFEARREAEAWLARDPLLASPASAGLREILRHRWGRRLELGSVG